MLSRPCVPTLFLLGSLLASWTQHGSCHEIERRDTFLPWQIFEPRSELEPRQNIAGPCGVNNSEAVCADGYCCSQNGMCGQGRAFCDSPQCMWKYGPGCDANKKPSGTNTTSIPRPQFGSQPYGTPRITACTEAGKCAMTYDDGPYIYTTELLDILKSKNAKATFFITAVNVGKGQIDDPATGYPAVIRRMFHEGHQVGAHTWSHKDLSKLTHYERMDELVKVEMALSNILGFLPTYMRAPYVSCTQASGCVDDVTALGYHLTDFDVDIQDSQNYQPARIQNAKEIAQNVLMSGDPTKDSFLMYGHDFHEQTAINFTRFLVDEVTKLGYKMVTVGECLGDPEGNWYRNPVNGSALTEAQLSAASSAIQASPSATEPALPTIEVTGAAKTSAGKVALRPTEGYLLGVTLVVSIMCF